MRSCSDVPQGKKPRVRETVDVSGLPSGQGPVPVFSYFVIV